MSIVYESLRYPEKNFPVVFHTDYRKNHEGPPRVPPGINVQIYASNDSHSVHWHESLEVLRVLDGTAAVRMNEQVRRVGPGELAVVNANALHNVMAIGSYCLYDCLILSSEACRDWGFPVTETVYETQFRDAHINRLFDGISREFRRQEEEYKPMVVAKCIELMAWLSRSHRTLSGKPTLGSKRAAHVQDVIRYIQQNYGRALSLEELGEVFGYSRFYLAHSFAEFTGTSIVEYLLLVRMRAACRLLEEPDKTVAEIAEACGYATVSSFSTAFRKKNGLSPSEYRRRAAKVSDSP